MEDKTILLTGATGFLGSYLLEALINEGYKVIILKRSFSNTWRINNFLDKVKSYDVDKDPLKKPFEENRIDVVIHTATNYGRKGEDSSEIVNINLLFPIRLLETAKSFNTFTFFNTDTLLHKYLTPYALSKKQLVEWLKVFSDKIRVVNLRIEHMYGPKADNTNFVSWLINEMVNERDEIRLTKGEQKRDFVYISDIVLAYLTVLRNLEKLNSFNELDVGTGNFITIKDFVIKTKEIVEEILSKKINTYLNFGALSYREGEFEEIKEDLSGLSKLGWKPSVGLEDGLKKTIKYQLEET
jgi:nucleoside-diphosphate-sugar epimerase